MLFSQRKGLKPVKSVIQADSMDADLRKGLWNSLYAHYWCNVNTNDAYFEDRRGIKKKIRLFLESNKTLSQLIINLWMNYFKKNH